MMMIETNTHTQYGPRKVRFFSRPLGSAACLHDVQESREIWAGSGEFGRSQDVGEKEVGIYRRGGEGGLKRARNVFTLEADLNDYTQ